VKLLPSLLCCCKGSVGLGGEPHSTTPEQAQKKG